MSENKAALMLLCSSILVSSGGLLVKLVDWNPFVVFGGRSIVAGLGMYLLGGGRKGLHITRQTLLMSVLIAMCGFAFVISTKMTTAANAVIFKNTAPVFLIVFSALFTRARYRRRDYVTVVLALAGILLCFIDKLDMTQLWGNIIALSCGAMFGLQYLVFSKNRTPTDSYTSLCLGQCVGALAMIPFYFLYPPSLTVQHVGGIAALGLLQITLPNIRWTIGLSHCHPFKASLINLIEPLLNPLWVFLVLGEKPGRFALLGGAIVVTVITLWSVMDVRHAVRVSTPLASSQQQNDTQR